MIKNGTFTSVWDGSYEITTKCKINMETKEVFDIEIAEVDESFEILENEYITMDGEDYAVYSAYTDDEDWNEETCYWYK